MDQQSDWYWMQQALDCARQASRQGEVPVGAVLVKDNELIAGGHNQPIRSHDPSAHAEIVVLRAAAQQLQNYRLPNTTLYVTLEPCVMCIGAVLHARVARLVFAATDPKSGAVGSVLDVPGCRQLNHHLQVQGGVCADESASLLKNFFVARR